VPPLATALFDYTLPAGLIAQEPAVNRDRSRLLVVDRSAHTIAHRIFADLPELLQAGDQLFRNKAAVLPARLRAVRPTGGQVECLLLNPLIEPAAGSTSPTGESWRCLLKPGRKLPAGATFADPDGAFQARILAWEEEGVAQVAFLTRAGESMTVLAHRLGEVPLPPYIARPDQTHRTQDLDRYQTVYADRERSVAAAAPTAGLHFTPDLLQALAARGVGTADLILHVGLGTFRPIATETISAHPIHRERYEIPAATQRALFAPASAEKPGRRIAVGTTAVRAIEDFLRTQTAPSDQPYFSEAAIYLYPPAVFRGVDALITNFHQPRSTLLCLVAAFLAPASTEGIAWLKEIYAEAIAREYRFFSYGDAMLIL
jgi:S-adenosylmethionine:tRNA ribosyltransferase-isomerase